MNIAWTLRHQDSAIHSLWPGMHQCIAAPTSHNGRSKILVVLQAIQDVKDVETNTPKRVGHPLTTSRPQLRQQPEQQQLSTFYRHQRRQWPDRQLHRQEAQQRWSTATS